MSQSVTIEDFQRNRQRLRDALGNSGPAYISIDREIAKRAVEGEILFEHLGKHYVQVGRTHIDWSGSHKHNSEWPAQLNRFFQLPSLADAYLQTGDECYAEAARDYLADWMHANPVSEPIPPRYNNTLCLSIRTMLWTLTLADFLPSPAFSDEFVDQLLQSIRAQLEFLRAHLSTDGNWRIAHVDTLLMVAIMLPFLPEADGWRETAVEALNDALNRQVLPDGMHAERTPDYHHWMTKVFANYWQLATAMPKLGLSMPTEPIARMFDYALASTSPNGSKTGLHDTVARLTGPYLSETADARAAFRRKAGLPDILPPTSQFFPDAGQVFLRDRWTEDAAYVTFDASSWGGAHCHLSRNAMQVHAFGRSLLVDPGSLTYELSDPKMASGKSTRAHNTLNLNGWNQSKANPTGTRALSLPGYDIVSSCYEGGYWPGEYTWSFDHGHGAGIYGAHFRVLLWIHRQCIVVIDHFTRGNEGEAPMLESNWQLSDGPIAIDPARRRVVTQHPDANLLLLFPLAAPDATVTVHEGEHDPERGWLPGNGDYTSAPQISLTAPMTTSTVQLATILVPFAGTAAPKVEAAADVHPVTGMLSIRLHWDDGADEILATPRLSRAIGAYNDIVTDASLVYMRKDAADAPVSGLAVDATYLRPYATESRLTPEMFTFKKS